MSLTEDLKKGLVLSSNGHLGLLTDLIHLFRDVLEIYRFAHKNKSLNWLTISNTLFNPPQIFFGDNQSLLVCQSGVCKAYFYIEDRETKKALECINCIGWLHEEKTKEGRRRFVFASPIHRWYCHTLLSMYIESISEIHHSTPLKLAVDAIVKFNPSQTPDYQQEFFRCLSTILDGRFVVSPEFMIKPDIKSGPIDFYIAQKKWGLVIIEDCDCLGWYMERIEHGGQFQPISYAKEPTLSQPFHNVLRPKGGYRVA